MGSINVETGKIDKEFTLNRGNWCSGCINYYDESDTVCKRGCKYYPKPNREVRDRLITK